MRGHDQPFSRELAASVRSLGSVTSPPSILHTLSWIMATFSGSHSTVLPDHHREITLWLVPVHIRTSLGGGDLPAPRSPLMLSHAPAHDLTREAVEGLRTSVIIGSPALLHSVPFLIVFLSLSGPHYILRATLLKLPRPRPPG